MDYEEEFQWQFDWYICERADLIWLGHHPQASLLDARHLYTFDSHDWVGINDRYWAVPSDQRSRLLITDIFYRICQLMLVHDSNSSHDLWLLHIERNNIQVALSLLAFV